LFCGIGGLTYGLKTAGITVLAGLDNDNSCEYAYKNNHALLETEGIHFPWVDPRDEEHYGYVKFFKRKVYFNGCHFYTSLYKQYFSVNYVEFYGCVFYTDYFIIGIDKEIYHRCDFKQQFSTLLMENITPSLEVYTCTFQKEVILDCYCLRIILEGYQKYSY
jgi:hypothetical protein